MWSSRSLLLRRRPRPLSSAVTTTIHKQLVGGSTRTRATVAAAAATQQQQWEQQHESSSSWSYNHAAAASAAAGVLAMGGYLTHKQQHDAQCDTAAASSPFSLARVNGNTNTESPETPSKVRRMPTRNQPRNVMLHRMRSVRARHMLDKYKVDWKTVLGEGAYGSVHPARLAATGEKVALKKISKRYTNSSSFKIETDALLRIYDNGGHPNISGLRDMYEDATHYYMILDLVSGGEMFEHLINFGAYSEADAARLMHEVASALAFLHGVGVVHADLKPENLLLCSKKRHDGTIKMIDFGCAVVSDAESYLEQLLEEQKQQQSEGAGGNHATTANELVTTLAIHKSRAEPKDASSTGTTAYWPPERFQKGAIADPAMDMWSLGVILYIMLSGVHPFDVKGVSTNDEIEKRIRANPAPPLGPEYTSHLSDSAIDLIQKLMEQDPQKRLTAFEMLNHPWVLGETAATDKMVDSDKKLSLFKDVRNKLEAGIFAVLVSHGHQNVTLSEAKTSPKTRNTEKGSGESSTHIMKRAFEVFDAEGKGFVTSDDLGRVVRDRTGSELSSSDTKEFLATSRGGVTGGDASTMAQRLSLSDFSKLFSGLKHKHFPRGHVIFHAGDEGDSMYFLCSGKINVHTRKGQLVSILRAGDFFGEGSLLDDKKGKRFTTAKCATPVDVIKIKHDDFKSYVASSETAKNELRLKWRARNLDYAKNLIRLQTNVKTLVLKKGDVVYKEGDTGTAMYRVMDQDGGELEVTHGGRPIHKYTEGESFGESSLLFARPRSSTVTCVTDTCKLHEMRGEDFITLVDASPEMATALRDMCRKRLFKKAVKAYSLENKRGLSDEDIVAAFHDADIGHTGNLNLEEVKRLMHRMDAKFPVEEIEALLKFIDVDEDGLVSLAEFKRLFRQFEVENKAS